MRILHLIPYHRLYPPKNGGQLRCFHLMDELSKYFKVDVISYQSDEAIRMKGYINENVCFYSTGSFKRKNDLLDLLPSKVRNALRYRMLIRSFKGPATSGVLEFSNIIENLAMKNSYTYIIMEHLSSMDLTPILQRWMPNVPRIFDAHNVDHLLAKKGSSEYTRTLKKEKEIYRHADILWACSKLDATILEELNSGKIRCLVVPNGVDAKKKSYVAEKSNTHMKIIFCGSLQYAPNKNGLLWFYEQIWPILLTEMPNLKLVVVGRGGDADYEQLNSDSSVDFIGEVLDVAPFYRDTFVAIAPLLEGSGTRLKILEAMSFGNPTVTTSKGIEGINFKNNEHSVLANDKKSFAIAILDLIRHPQKADRIRQNARKLVEENYSWDKIGYEIKKSLL